MLSFQGDIFYEFGFILYFFDKSGIISHMSLLHSLVGVIFFGER